MNPLKCFFGVSSGGFIVRKDGIQLDPAKTKAIPEMKPPRNLKELRGLQGRLAYIRRFISNLSGRCQPFTRLMKKGVNFVWDQDCEEAFQSIKQYLANPPALAAPVQGRPFILYTCALEYSLGAMLAQENDEGKEMALYYLSRKMMGAEFRYSPVEKECLALMFAVQKLRHYLLSNTIRLISRVNPLKILVTKAGALNARLAKWSILLSQFDIVYVPQKAVKGQALADFLAAHPLLPDSELRDELPDEPVYHAEAFPEAPPKPWEMYFDGASRYNHKYENTSGVGIVFITPEGYMIPHSFVLTEPCSNNVAEYQALIIGMEIAREMGISRLEVRGDSKLIVNQMNDLYEVRKPDLLPYHAAARRLALSFPYFNIEHVPRGQNARADALAGLAAAISLPKGETLNVVVCERKILPPLNTHQAIAECHQVWTSRLSVNEVGIDDWRNNSSITSSSASYRTTQEKRSASEDGRLDSTSTSKQRCYTKNCTMASSYGAFRIRKQMRS